MANRNSGEKADLRGANLAGVDLNDADLCRADLSGADLNGANLNRAILVEANLKGANLCGACIARANLSRANLFKADLRGADIRGADISQADLREADLQASDLREADLSGAFIQKANLRKCYLTRANFNTANLTGADLSETDLTAANFNRAILSGVNLHVAVLNGVQFSETNLREANLRESQLFETNFIRSNLDGTDVGFSRVGRSTFSGVDLQGVIGLDTLNHAGPSMVGMDTARLSKGNISDLFLRGCGLNDWEIELIRLYDPVLSMMQVNDILYRIFPLRKGNSIQFYSCFISYSHLDKTFAQTLHDCLQGSGIRCWLDEHQMLPGDDIYEQIDHGIKFWDKVLLCCSQHSLTSWWVDDEINKAFQKERDLMKDRKAKVRVLIPLNLDGYFFSKEWVNGKKSELMIRLAANFTNWENDLSVFDKQIQKLIKALQVGNTGRELPPPCRL